VLDSSACPEDLTESLRFNHVDPEKISIRSVGFATPFGLQRNACQSREVIWDCQQTDLHTSPDRQISTQVQSRSQLQNLHTRTTIKTKLNSTAKIEQYLKIVIDIVFYL
jgi:hypothetical protein